jgi:hypothetical protein
MLALQQYLTQDLWNDIDKAIDPNRVYADFLRPGEDSLHTAKGIKVLPVLTDKSAYSPGYYIGQKRYTYTGVTTLELAPEAGYIHFEANLITQLGTESIVRQSHAHETHLILFPLLHQGGLFGFDGKIFGLLSMIEAEKLVQSGQQFGYINTYKLAHRMCQITATAFNCFTIRIESVVSSNTRAPFDLTGSGQFSKSTEHKLKNMRFRVTYQIKFSAGDIPTISDLQCELFHSCIFSHGKLYYELRTKLLQLKSYCESNKLKARNDDFCYIDLENKVREHNRAKRPDTASSPVKAKVHSARDRSKTIREMLEEYRLSTVLDEVA